MQYRTLGNTGLSVSVIGFGASPLGNVFETISSSGDGDLIGSVVDSGINFFDVSPYYGHGLAEERLGAALIPYRKNVVLATKCGRHGVDRFDFSANGIKTQFEESLRRLRTDTVDLLQLHDVEFGDMNQLLEEALPTLTELKEQGKTRFIGITGYWPGFLAMIAANYPVDTVLNYCHSNLFVSDMDSVLAPVAHVQGFGMINASPLHMGLLGNAPVPAWHPAPPAVREAAQNVIELCQERKIDAATLAIWTCVQESKAATTLTGISNVSQLKSSCAALSFSPTEELLSSVRELIAPVHNVSWSQGKAENQIGLFENRAAIR